MQRLEATAQPLKNDTRHQLILTGRSELKCEGIDEIISYNEQEVALQTSVGTLVIGGEKLSISSLSVESGQVRVFGNIRFMEYKEQRQGGAFRRLWR